MSQVLDSLESPGLCRILREAECPWGQDLAGDNGRQYKAFVTFQLLMSSRADTMSFCNAEVTVQVTLL